MAKIILICGWLCGGKSTYAESLRKRGNAVILSSDEAVLRLFGTYLGEDHGRIAGNVERYLLDLALKLLDAGVSVILDWGFWTRQARGETSAFFAGHGFAPEWHYVEVSHAVWRRNIERRNRDVRDRRVRAFPVDEGLEAKFRAVFEPPAREEMDVWYRNDWTEA